MSLTGFTSQLSSSESRIETVNRLGCPEPYYGRVEQRYPTTSGDFYLAIYNGECPDSLGFASMA